MKLSLKKTGDIKSRIKIRIRKGDNKMTVTIEDSCIACGACESICDAVFSVEDKAVVNAANIAGNEDAIQEAAGACPVSAIVVE